MVFKLSEQVDNVPGPNVPFETYQAYLESHKHLIPKSALSLMLSENWYSGGSGSKSPYWSNLKLVDLDLENKELNIVLTKSDYVESPFDIVLKYTGVAKLDMPNFSLPENSCIKWRYEEVVHFQHSDKDNIPMFSHNIEWSNGDIWSVSAESIEAVWVE